MPRLSEPDFWQPYLPQLRREFVDLVLDILIAGGDAGAKGIPLLSVLIDWDVFNQAALDWLDMYLGGATVAPVTSGGAFNWALSLTEATRRGVAREIDRWIRAGAALPELERRLLPFFDQRRAHRVAVTEVTRVYASGNIMAWKASGVVGGKRWMTAVDEHVCFPKWTMVETDTGPVAIQDIRPGIKVWTRQGLRRVVAVSARPYRGPITRLSAQGKRIVATADHPVWESEQGWLPIGEFKPGNRIETFGKQGGQVNRVLNIMLGNAQDAPPVPHEKGVFPGVSLPITMPVSAVHFQRDAAFWQYKVNRIAADFGLLAKGNPNILQRHAYLPFQPVFALKPSIASERTELPVGVFRLAAKLSATRSAVFDDRRAAALLGTVLSVAPLFTGERFTTSSANRVESIGRPTSVTTNGISVGSVRRNTKHLPALRARLFDHNRGAAGLIASFRTVSPVALSLDTFKGLATMLARRVSNRFALGNAIALLRAKGTTVLSALGLSKRLAALLTDVGKRHAAPLATDLSVLYHRLLGSAITVYDIQVEGVPEFYANGILVHNCPICSRLHNTFVDLDRGWEFTPEALAADPALARAIGAPMTIVAPPSHVNCRCWIQPVVYEAMSPEEIAAGRFDPARGGAGASGQGHGYINRS